MHIFEQSGFGTAPFRIITVIPTVPPRSMLQANPLAYNSLAAEYQAQARNLGVKLGCCEHCGMVLMNNYIVKSSEGHHHVVGCDCAEKTGDRGIISQIKEIARQKRIAKKKEKIEAKAREIKANGKTLRKALMTEHGDLLRKAWAMRKGNSFLTSIIKQALLKGVLSPLQISAVERFIGKAVEIADKTKAENERKAKADFVGSVGNKHTSKIEIIRRIPLMNTMFPCTMTIMRDEDGNTIKTFGNCPLKEGDTATITFKVKDHAFYKDERQTIVTHIKVVV